MPSIIMPQCCDNINCHDESSFFVFLEDDKPGLHVLFTTETIRIDRSEFETWFTASRCPKLRL